MTAGSQIRFRVVELVTPVVVNMPERYEANALLGEAYFQKRDFARSTELLEKAITIKRGTPSLLNILAKSHFELGNHSRAVEILERSLSMNPDQPDEKLLLETWNASAGAR